ncbi:uncharacterized protein LOC123259467 [Cotesia glomerata]|nr:uncharacterized protein LOC123259467 [Cotesia glomerata]
MTALEKMNNRDLLYKKTIVSPIEVLGVLDDDFEANPLLVIHKIVGKYIKKISEGSITKRIADGFYTVLCYEYNLTTGSPESVLNFDQTLFNIITKYIYENYDKEGKELIPILYEIIVLHLKLYFSVPVIGEFYKNFIASAKDKKNDSNIYYKVTECFVDALCLKHSPDQHELTEASHLILEEIIIWYKDITLKDWVLFVAIITKLVKTLEKRIALDYLWVMILNYPSSDWEKSLSLLNVVIDDVLALSSPEKLSINLNCCRSEMLWQLILQGLMSPVEQNHKLGLHSMKRILNFLDKYQITLNQTNLVPFIGCPNYKSEMAVKHAVNYFFLLIESLEEDQGSLIHQTVVQLEILIQFHYFHCILCLNCLDFIWLECIFKRVLAHKTIEVVEVGLITLLKLDPRFYYDDLLVLLINTLNNVAIHDSETFCIETQIIKELAELFVKAEYAQVSLVKKFIFYMSQVSWEPVPLFYIIYCLCKAGYMINYHVQFNRFEEEELKCLEIIIDQNLSNQLSVSINFFCQNIINIINIFAGVSNQAALDILSRIFPKLEAASSCHEFIINSLRNKVTPDQAAQYIYSQCEKLSKILVKKNQDITGLEEFAKMTVYLFAASLIFRASNASELKAMCTIFNIIIVDENQQKYVDKIHHTKILQLLNYFFLGLTQICGIDKLNFTINSFMAVLESVLVSVFSTFERPIVYSYNELEIYTETFQTISELITSKVEDYCGYFIKVLSGTERVIEIMSNDEYKDLKYLFALRLQYICIKYLEKYNVNTLKLLLNSNMLSKEVKFKENGEAHKMAKECYSLIARSIVQTIKLVPNNSPFLISGPVKTLQQLLALEKEQIMPSAIELMTKMLYLTCIDNYGNVIEPFFELVWNYLWSMEKNDVFFKCYELFAEFSVQIVGFKGADKLRNEGVGYIAAMWDKGKAIARLRRLLVKKLISVGEESFVFFQNIALKMLIYVSEEDPIKERLEAQVQFFTFNNSNPERRNLAAVDMTSRARLVLLFCSMLRQGKSFKELVGTLIAELEERKVKCDLNSDRIKCRVMQMLMVLQPYLNQDRAFQIIKVISESFVVEKVSPIVRTLQEWLLIKIFLSYAKTLEDLWKLFDKVKNNKESVTSVALIILHVAINALPKSQVLVFIRTAIMKLDAFIYNKEYHGCYCQVVILKLIRLLPPCNITNHFKDLMKIIETNLISSEHSTQLSQDFRLNKFHPHKNYTIKTIFYDLPRLMNSCKGEWILPSILDYENSAMITQSSIKISNVCTLETAQATQTKQSKTQLSTGKNVNSSDNDVEIVELE